MKIQIVSDLHIEKYETVDVKNLIEPDAEILVMAGDIGSMYRIRQLRGFLSEVCSLFKIVIYVPGHHEYYRIPRLPPRPFSHLEKSLSFFANDYKNFFYLSRSSLVINSYQFIGATLWSNANIVPDKIVRIANFNTERYQFNHKLDKKFIKKEIEYAKMNNLVPIVITHYPPLKDCINSKRKKDKFVSLYTNDLGNLVSDAKVWIYGHTHFNTDRQIGDCRVLSNQLGKKKDNIQNYEKSFVIEI